MDTLVNLPQTLALTEPAAPANRREAIAFHMAALEDLADPAGRSGGWTPFSRKLFLQVMAETGRVTTACDTCRLSKQSAYALRARDPVFAAGWDAACELARMPLADALYEQALDGLTDTITRDDGRTVTRHRIDSRLSIAVLNRLDRRCDRAVAKRAIHLNAVRAWDAFVAAIGDDDDAHARAILEPAKLSQPSQLAPEPMPPGPPVWWDEEAEEWRTHFAAPPGFDGFSIDEADRYERSLTDDELDLVERKVANENDDVSASQVAERDEFFDSLRGALDNEQADQDAEPPIAPAPATPGPTSFEVKSSPRP